MKICQEISLEITGPGQIIDTRGIGKVRELKGDPHKDTKCKPRANNEVEMVIGI